MVRMKRPSRKKTGPKPSKFPKQSVTLYLSHANAEYLRSLKAEKNNFVDHLISEWMETYQHCFSRPVTPLEERIIALNSFAESCEQLAQQARAAAKGEL